MFNFILYYFQLIFFHIGNWIILPFLRLQIGVWTYFHHWWMQSPNISQDGCRVCQGVQITRDIRYGEGERELLDILTPSADWLEIHPDYKNRNVPILFAHGGGFLFCNSEVTLHALTPFVRKGFTVISMNYPLSPKEPFPAPVESCLKCLKFLKLNYGFNEIHLMGESAGGNLVTMASFLLSNPSQCSLFPSLLPHFDSPEQKQQPQNQKSKIKKQKTKNENSNFPKIHCVNSIVGLLDCKSWKKSWGAFILEWCIWNYKGNGDKVSLGCFEDIESYPPTLLLAGKQDLLFHSSQRVYTLLKKNGHKVELKVFPSHHGFFSFPPAWIDTQYSLEAVNDIIQHCISHENEYCISQENEYCISHENEYCISEEKAF